MFAGSWLGSLPETTWHFTHCHFSKSCLPAATIAGSEVGFVSYG